MKNFLFSIFFFYLVNISFANEIFVGYLKPYTQKTEFKNVFKRRDPTEEPYKISERLVGSKANQIKEEKIKDIELKAILYHPIHKKAYINDSLVADGDVLKDEIVVKEINQDYVKVEKNKKIYTLKIEEGDK